MEQLELTSAVFCISWARKLLINNMALTFGVQWILFVPFEFVILPFSVVLGLHILN